MPTILDNIELSSSSLETVIGSQKTAISTNEAALISSLSVVDNYTANDNAKINTYIDVNDLRTMESKTYDEKLNLLNSQKMLLLPKSFGIAQDDLDKLQYDHLLINIPVPDIISENNITTAPEMNYGLNVVTYTDNVIPYDPTTPFPDINAKYNLFNQDHIITKSGYLDISVCAELTDANTNKAPSDYMHMGPTDEDVHHVTADPIALPILYRLQVGVYKTHLINIKALKTTTLELYTNELLDLYNITPIECAKIYQDEQQYADALALLEAEKKSIQAEIDALTLKMDECDEEILKSEYLEKLRNEKKNTDYINEKITAINQYLVKFDANSALMSDESKTELAELKVKFTDSRQTLLISLEEVEENLGTLRSNSIELQKAKINENEARILYDRACLTGVIADISQAELTLTEKTGNKNLFASKVAKEEENLASNQLLVKTNKNYHNINFNALYAKYIEFFGNDTQFQYELYLMKTYIDEYNNLNSSPIVESKIVNATIPQFSINNNKITLDIDNRIVNSTCTWTVQKYIDGSWVNLVRTTVQTNPDIIFNYDLNASLPNLLKLKIWATISDASTNTIYVDLTKTNGNYTRTDVTPVETDKMARLHHYKSFINKVDELYNGTEANLLKPKIEQLYADIDTAIASIGCDNAEDLLETVQNTIVTVIQGMNLDLPINAELNTIISTYFGVLSLSNIFDKTYLESYFAINDINKFPKSINDTVDPIQYSKLLISCEKPSALAEYDEFNNKTFPAPINRGLDLNDVYTDADFSESTLYAKNDRITLFGGDKYVAKTAGRVNLNSIGVADIMSANSNNDFKDPEYADSNDTIQADPVTNPALYRSQVSAYKGLLEGVKVDKNAQRGFYNTEKADLNTALAAQPPSEEEKNSEYYTDLQQKLDRIVVLDGLIAVLDGEIAILDIKIQFCVDEINKSTYFENLETKKLNVNYMNEFSDSINDNFDHLNEVITDANPSFVALKTKFNDSKKSLKDAMTDVTEKQVALDALSTSVATANSLKTTKQTVLTNAEGVYNDAMKGDNTVDKTVLASLILAVHNAEQALSLATDNWNIALKNYTDATANLEDAKTNVKNIKKNHDNNFNELYIEYDKFFNTDGSQSHFRYELYLTETQLLEYEKLTSINSVDDSFKLKLVVPVVDLLDSHMKLNVDHKLVDSVEYKWDIKYQSGDTWVDLLSLDTSVFSSDNASFEFDIPDSVVEVLKLKIFVNQKISGVTPVTPIESETVYVNVVKEMGGVSYNLPENYVAMTRKSSLKRMSSYKKTVIAIDYLFLRDNLGLSPANNVSLVNYDKAHNSARKLVDKVFYDQGDIKTDKDNLATELDALITANDANTTSAGSFVGGKSYKIVLLGTTDFSAIGATANAAVGDTFIASDVGTGTGTALDLTFSTKVTAVKNGLSDIYTDLSFIKWNNIRTGTTYGVSYDSHTQQIKNYKDYFWGIDIMSSPYLIDSSFLTDSRMLTTPGSPVVASDISFLDECYGKVVSIKALFTAIGVSNTVNPVTQETTNNRLPSTKVSTAYAVPSALSSMFSVWTSKAQLIKGKFLVFIDTDKGDFKLCKITKSGFSGNVFNTFVLEFNDSYSVVGPEATMIRYYIKTPKSVLTENLDNKALYEIDNNMYYSVSLGAADYDYSNGTMFPSSVINPKTHEFTLKTAVGDIVQVTFPFANPIKKWQPNIFLSKDDYISLPNALFVKISTEGASGNSFNNEPNNYVTLADAKSLPFTDKVYFTLDNSLSLPFYLNVLKLKSVAYANIQLGELYNTNDLLKVKGPAAADTTIGRPLQLNITSGAVVVVRYGSYDVSETIADAYKLNLGSAVNFIKTLFSLKDALQSVNSKNAEKDNLTMLKSKYNVLQNAYFGVMYAGIGSSKKYVDRLFYDLYQGYAFDGLNNIQELITTPLYPSASYPLLSGSPLVNPFTSYISALSAGLTALFDSFERIRWNDIRTLPSVRIPSPYEIEHYHNIYFPDNVYYTEFILPVNEYFDFFDTDTTMASIKSSLDGLNITNDNPLPQRIYMIPSELDDLLIVWAKQKEDTVFPLSKGEYVIFESLDYKLCRVTQSGFSGNTVTSSDVETVLSLVKALKKYDVHSTQVSTVAADYIDVNSIASVIKYNQYVTKYANSTTKLLNVYKIGTDEFTVSCDGNIVPPDSELAVLKKYVTKTSKTILEEDLEKDTIYIIANGLVENRYVTLREGEGEGSKKIHPNSVIHPVTREFTRKCASGKIVQVVRSIDLDVVEWQPNIFLCKGDLVCLPNGRFVEITTEGVSGTENDNMNEPTFSLHQTVNFYFTAPAVVYSVLKLLNVSSVTLTELFIDEINDTISIKNPSDSTIIGRPFKYKILNSVLKCTRYGSYNKDVVPKPLAAHRADICEFREIIRKMGDLKVLLKNMIVLNAQKAHFEILKEKCKLFASSFRGYDNWWAGTQLLDIINNVNNPDWMPSLQTTDKKMLSKLKQSIRDVDGLKKDIDSALKSVLELQSNSPQDSPEESAVAYINRLLSYNQTGLNNIEDFSISLSVASFYGITDDDIETTISLKVDELMIFVENTQSMLTKLKVYYPIDSFLSELLLKYVAFSTSVEQGLREDLVNYYEKSNVISKLKPSYNSLKEFIKEESYASMMFNRLTFPDDWSDLSETKLWPIDRFPSINSSIVTALSDNVKLYIQILENLSDFELGNGAFSNIQLIQDLSRTDITQDYRAVHKKYVDDEIKKLNEDFESFVGSLVEDVMDAQQSIRGLTANVSAAQADIIDLQQEMASSQAKNDAKYFPKSDKNYKQLDEVNKDFHIPKGHFIYFGDRWKIGQGNSGTNQLCFYNRKSPEDGWSKAIPFISK
jgi:hypothetical protein